MLRNIIVYLKHHKEPLLVTDLILDLEGSRKTDSPFFIYDSIGYLPMFAYADSEFPLAYLLLVQLMLYQGARMHSLYAFNCIPHKSIIRFDYKINDFRLQANPVRNKSHRLILVRSSDGPVGPCSYCHPF